MNSTGVVPSASRFLNKVLFGARVTADPDVVSQWGTIIVSYVLNLLLVLVPVVIVSAITGHYRPLVAPLEKPALQVILATANLTTFSLTYLASLSWRMGEQAIERQRAANRSNGEYWILLLTLATASFVFLLLLFLVFNIAAIVGSACVNSALLQLAMSRRVMKS